MNNIELAHTTVLDFSIWVNQYKNKIEAKTRTNPYIENSFIIVKAEYSIIIVLKYLKINARLVIDRIWKSQIKMLD